MPRSATPVAIATCSRVVGQVAEDLLLIEALSRKGIEAIHVAWDDDTANWSSFALVVIRSTWDYPDRLHAFLNWASQLSNVFNPLPILRWNTDKRYLKDLAQLGIPIIPTHFLDPGSTFDLPSSPFVVKPAVSCGAQDTVRYHPNDSAEAQAHVRRLHDSGRTVMIQPYLSSIEESGETAVIFIGGRYSHSIRRDAVLCGTGARSESDASVANVRVHIPTPEERRLADAVIAQAPGGSTSLLYGRVDMIPGSDGSPLLMELELTEPSLFLEFSDGGVERLADCIATVVLPAMAVIG